MKPMRRIKQALDLVTCQEILNRNTAGVLSINDEYAYGVPISYVYDQDHTIYFHCALSGHKIDAIKNNNKVSFTVIDQDQIVGKEYTTYFRSVIVFGEASIIENEEAKKNALMLLGKKYYPEGTMEELHGVINPSLKRTNVLALTINEMTGKEAIELVKQRESK